MKTYVFHSVVVGLLMLTGCQTPRPGSALSDKSKVGDDAIAKKSAKSDSPNSSADGVKTADQKGEVRFSGGNATDLDSGVELMQRNAGDTASTDSKWLNDKLKHGDEAFTLGRLDQAKTYYRMVLDEQPNHSIAHHRLAVVADMQRQFQAADSHYQAALKGRPTNPDLLSDLGWSYIQQGKYADAEESLSLALGYDQTHRKALDRLGYLYGQQGDYDRALEMFRRANPEDVAQAKLAKLAELARNARGGAGHAMQPPPQGDQRFTTTSPRRDSYNSWPTAVANTPGLASGLRGNPPPSQGTSNQTHGGLQRPLYRQNMGGTPGGQQFANGTTSPAQYAGFPQDVSPSGYNTDRPLITSNQAGPANINPPNSMSSFSNSAAAGTMTGTGNFGGAAGSTGATPGLNGSIPQRQSLWPPRRQEVQPTGFEQSESTIQSWPFAPNDGQTLSSQQPPRPVQHGLTHSGPAAGNAFAGNLPAGQQAAGSQRKAALMGMNAGPTGMLPIVTGQQGSLPPAQGTVQPGYGPQRNVPQSLPPANFTPGRPVSQLPLRPYPTPAQTVPHGSLFPPSQPGFGASAPANVSGFTTRQPQVGIPAAQNRFASSAPGSQAAWSNGPAPAITPGPIGSCATLSSDLNAVGPGPAAPPMYDSRWGQNVATPNTARYRPMPDPRLPAGGNPNAPLPVRQYQPPQQQHNQLQYGHTQHYQLQHDTAPPVQQYPQR